MQYNCVHNTSGSILDLVLNTSRIHYLIRSTSSFVSEDKHHHMVELSLNSRLIYFLQL